MPGIRPLRVSVAERMPSAPWLRRWSAAAITSKVSASPSLRVPPGVRVGDAAEALTDQLHAVAPQPGRRRPGRGRQASGIRGASPGMGIVVPWVQKVPEREIPAQPYG